MEGDKRPALSGLGKVGGGEIFRWTGSLLDPFKFEVVGQLGADPAYLVEHEDRIFVSTWGGDGIAGMLLYMSPKFTTMLTAADASNWQVAWRLSDYEVEPAAVQGGGALASFGGSLYWGTMCVPLTGMVAFEALYGTTPDAAAALGTYRPIMIFRGTNFDTTPPFEVLYGNYFLPKYDPVKMAWKLVPNNMNQFPKYGMAGFNNFFNNYTWAMEVYKGQLMVGTMDWSYLIYEGIGQDITSNLPETMNWATHFWGADLWSFTFPGFPAIPIGLSGLGNYSSYGIRTMVADDAFYVGMANPMNLLTDPNDNRPQGGWELIKLHRPFDWISNLLR